LPPTPPYPTYPFLVSSSTPEKIANICLSFFSFTEAVKQIIEYLGMQPCERSDKVNTEKNSHALLLAGVFRGGHDVLVRARLAFDQGVTMNITVRSDNAVVSEVVLSAVG